MVSNYRALRRATLRARSTTFSDEASHSPRTPRSSPVMWEEGAQIDKSLAENASDFCGRLMEACENKENTNSSPLDLAAVTDTQNDLIHAGFPGNTDQHDQHAIDYSLKNDSSAPSHRISVFQHTPAVSHVRIQVQMWIYFASLQRRSK